MKIKPTPSRRNLFLDLETIAEDPADEKGALNALTGRVVCVGMLADDGNRLTESVVTDIDESVILQSFWSFVLPGDVFVGHNVQNFDLMYLRQRSWVKGIRPSRKIDLRRYYTPSVLDTQQIFSNWGTTKYPGLDALATALGCGAKTAHGSNVAAWWAAGELEKIGEYCKADVRLTYKVFARLMFQPIPERFLALPINA